MALKPCLDCGTLSPTGRCLACRRAKDRARETTRPNSAQRGYGAAWRKLRAEHLADEPACRECGTTGQPDNPVTVDHVKPKSEGGTDDPTNLMTLCKRCHGRKTMTDRTRRGAGGGQGRGGTHAS